MVGGGSGVESLLLLLSLDDRDCLPVLLPFRPFLPPPLRPLLLPLLMSSLESLEDLPRLDVSSLESTEELLEELRLESTEELLEELGLPPLLPLCLDETLGDACGTRRICLPSFFAFSNHDDRCRFFCRRRAR